LARGVGHMACATVIEHISTGLETAGEHKSELQRQEQSISPDGQRYLRLATTEAAALGTPEAPLELQQEPQEAFSS
jgi:hypothetical protein